MVWELRLLLIDDTKRRETFIFRGNKHSREAIVLTNMMTTMEETCVYVGNGTNGDTTGAMGHG